MTSVASPFPLWFDKMPRFQLSTPMLHIQCDRMAEIPKEKAAHPLQRFAHTWTVRSADPSALTKLRLGAPGLTIVRVRPQLSTEAGGDVVARVRVSTDESQHLACVNVITKRHNELRVAFTNAADDRDDNEGSLVTEIELTHASQIQEVVAMGGGDATVEAGVVANDLHQSVLIAALHCSRLSVHETATHHLTFKDLFLGSAGCGEVYLTAKNLTVIGSLACGVLSDGCIHVDAPRMWAKTTHVAVVGDRGSVQIRATHGLATKELNGSVLGSGLVVVQSSPAVEIGRHTTCTRQSLSVEGAGRVDVAGVPTEHARVKIRDGGRVAVQPRHRLQLDASATSVLECVGQLPAKLDSTSAVVVVASYHDRLIRHRIVQATCPVAAIPRVPTVANAFDAPQLLHVSSGGLRETFLLPFLNLL